MSEMSPMMKQYLEIKENNKDAILFFRLGDFYEMFFDDARLASKELELTLTGRDCGQEERAPMCGVPYHSCDGYIARLIQKGYKVAICEQTEDPSKAKGIVKREVVRVVTPGTIIDTGMLDESKNNFISAIFLSKDSAGICFADVSTGELYATQAAEGGAQRIKNELGRFFPKEIVVNSEANNSKDVSGFIKDKLGSYVSPFDDKEFSIEESFSVIDEHFGKKQITIEKSGWEFALRALGALIKYLNETQKIDLSHLVNLSLYEQSQFMDIDLFTRRNLELTETMRQKEKKGSLLWVLDKTKTAMGGRMLRNWVEQPLISCTLINKRLNAVEELCKQYINRQEMINALDNVYDLERLMTRVVFGNANARDLKALSQTVMHMPAIKEQLKPFTSVLLSETEKEIDNLRDIHILIESAIAEEPPISIKEGGIIRNGYSEQVDELRSIMNDGQSWISKMEAEEREATGIKNLKIGYNKIFGYYIEVTRSYFDQIPERYIRKQTLANCERLITQELKEMENKILSAQERITQLEYELFGEIKNTIAAALHRIQATASAIAKLDVLCSFAEVAVKNNYKMPTVDYGSTIDIKDGRHPVVEKMLDNSLFVPNDTFLDNNENRLSIITGPNMAGKSTYMRQAAVITLMAQIGSFVPAEYAKIGVVDKIFTRVGASDDLASGQSTFMVEMSEVANILKNATKKSLLIFDEIGRGTSTFDGMSIARAVLEFVADNKKLGAKSLFATHYHELTELEELVDGVKNYNIAVKKRGDEITFLRKIVRGGADDSYGIEVAKLAGIPHEVIDRAKDILKALEEGTVVAEPKKRAKVNMEAALDQISMMDNSNNEVIEKLQKLDLNVLTPIEAMNILYEMKKMI